MRDRNPDEITRDNDEWLRAALDRLDRIEQAALEIYYGCDAGELRETLIDIATTRINEGAQT